MEMAFPPIEVHALKSSPTDKGKFSVISDSLESFNITFDELWTACLKTVTTPFLDTDRYMMKSHTVEPQGKDEILVKVVTNGAILQHLGKNKDGKDQIMYHQLIKHNKEERYMMLRELTDLWHFPLHEKEQGPWTREDVTGHWSWKHDGRMLSGYINFCDDGYVEWNKGVKQGRWEIEDGKTLYITVHASDHIFEMEENGKAMKIVEPVGRKTVLIRMEGVHYQCKRHFKILENPMRIECWTEERNGFRNANTDVAKAHQWTFVRPVVNTVMATMAAEQFLKPGSDARTAMEAFSSRGGRWYWVRDDGIKEFLEAALSSVGDSMFKTGLAKYLGFDWLAKKTFSELASMYSKSTQWHFSTKFGDLALCMTATIDFWQTEKARKEKLRGTYYQEIWPWMLHPGGSLPDFMFTGLDGQIYKGVVKFSWEGRKQVSDMRATTLGGQEVNHRMMKEIIDEELFISLEDVSRGLKATRVFRRYPGYVIDNETDELVEMATYSPNDFVYLWPGMKRNLAKGRNWVYASGEDVAEEQAVFKLPNGKTHVVLLETNPEAAQTCTCLKLVNFS